MKRCLLTCLLSAAVVPSHAVAIDIPPVEVVAQTPHSGGISAVAFSPEGNLVLSGGDRTLKLWDVATGSLLRTIDPDSGWVRGGGAAFSPDGRFVASGGNGTVQLWDPNSGSLVRACEPQANGIWTIAISPDGSQVAAGDAAGNITIWDAKTGAVIKNIVQGAPGSCCGAWITSLAYSPDQRQLLSGGLYGRLILWDVASGTLIKQLATDAQINSVAFSPDGVSAVFGTGGGGPERSSHDIGVGVWDINSDRLSRSIAADGSSLVNSVAASADGKFWLSGGADGKMKLWTASDGTLLQAFDARSGIESVAFSRDGSRVICGTVDNRLIVWEVAIGKIVQTLAGHAQTVRAAALSGDGAYIVSASDDDRLRLWDASSASLVRTFNEKATSVVAFSPDSKSFLSAGWDGSLKLWDTASGALIRSFASGVDPINSIAFSPDGTRIVSGSGSRHQEPRRGAISTLKIWEVATGQLLQDFGGFSEVVLSAVFSRDGLQVASASMPADPRASSVRVWNVATGRLITSMAQARECTSLAFSPVEPVILCGDLTGLALFNLNTGAQLAAFGEHPVFDAHAAFSPDGRRILAGRGYDLELWDTASGRLIRSFNKHLGAIMGAALSLDGKRVLSCSRDTTIRVWDADSGQELVRLLASGDIDWLAISPAGFFAASGKGTDLAAVVRGTDAFSVLQFFEPLYQPDLLAELLKGDPEGRYSLASQRLNLTGILNSGSAPDLDLLEKRTELLGPAIRIRVRLRDAGGGVGSRVVWRVDGSARGDPLAPHLPTGASNASVVEQVLRIDPNTSHLIEVVAYNEKGLLASLPLQLTVNAFGAFSLPPPQMHVLAIGINNYEKAGWRLNLAAGDAAVFGDAMKAVGSGLFTNVKVTLLRNEQATYQGIRDAFATIAGNPEVHPNDVFVLYMAGHGRYDGARYYFIQQDFNTDPLPRGRGQLVSRDAIGQDLLQSWIAKIQVNKKVIILDTCESAQGGGALIRALAAPRLTAMEQLQHATGDNLIAAAGEAAFEANKLGHGLLTYAILEELSPPPPGDPDETVTVDMIASHVAERVPALSREIFGEEQWPIRKMSSGLPIPLGFRRFRLTRPAMPPPIFHDYILMHDEVVHTKPDPSSVSDPAVRLAAPMIVDVLGVSDDGKWMRIQWGSGVGVGWVHSVSIAKPHSTPQ